MSDPLRRIRHADVMGDTYVSLEDLAAWFSDAAVWSEGMAREHLMDIVAELRQMVERAKEDEVTS